MQLRILFAASALLALPACDVVRTPGDGRDAPASVPDGAPGPQPPSTPVDNPYGDGDTPPGGTLPDTGDATDSGDETTSDPAGDSTSPDDSAAPDDATDTDPGTTPDTPTDTALGDGDPVDTGTDGDDAVPGDTDTGTDGADTTPLPVKFAYHAPGSLIPGSGVGARDETVYAPDMVFPVKDAPAYPQSQVWRFGGGLGGGDQCDPRNFDTPWQDNFCETRSKTRNTPLCPTNKVHQGQDIRVGTPEGCNQLRRADPADRTLYAAVATEDGEVIYKGGYYIQLRGADTGNIYTYIHLNMAALQVAVGDQVTAGQTLGFISNDFGGTPTTFHLHFELKSPIEGEGITHVPPYMSLVKAYERREQGRGERVSEDTVSVATVLMPPPDFEIIE